jgi:hypothetical protein
MRHAIFIAGLFMLTTGCQALVPRPIVPTHCNLPDTLQTDHEPTVERGRRRRVIDAVGWVWGIPGKVILWNCKIENHCISPDTEAVLVEYLIENDLDEVKVRLNQYRPLDDWRRLRRNTSVAWPWRYTFGAVSVLGETVFPGRIFGGDHYNPYTATIHLYSDVPAVALHEAAHAKDFARRHYPGTYAAVYLIPGVPLWHESIATCDVLAYVHYKDDSRLIAESYRVLYPAYGTYVGDACGHLVPKYATPIYFGAVLGGHVVGRWKLREHRCGEPVVQAGPNQPVP